MSDYFERVEDGLREAVRRRAHLPWYSRLRPRFSRPAAAAALAVGLVAAGSALAASGVFRTGQPIGANVPGSPDAYKGVAVARSVHVLGLEVSDPEGGPPWGLRIIRTTRGLKCVQVGRLVDGRIGVLGEDGAFRNDGLFHPLSSDFLNNGGCGTEDAHGDAFLNEARHGGPANGLLNGEAARAAAGGCYERAAGCPSRDLRDVYYGLLGPDAVSVTYTTASGALGTTPTAGADGAYLIVLPYHPLSCPKALPRCAGKHGEGMVEGPELSAPFPGEGVRQVIRAVSYRDGHSCRLPTTRQVARLLRSHEAGRLLGMGCPSVGYIAAPGPRYTEAQLATPVTARVVTAEHYCVTEARLEASIVPCDYGVPAGYRRTIQQNGRYCARRYVRSRGRVRIIRPGEPMVKPCGSHVPAGYRRLGPRKEVLVIAEFRSRVKITKYENHYEIRMTDTHDPGREECPGGGTFGPTQTNLRPGQLVRYTQLVQAECPGRSEIRVSFIAENGPGGGMPVPGLPGQGPEVPVGRTEVEIP